MLELCGLKMKFLPSPDLTSIRIINTDNSSCETFSPLRSSMRIIALYNVCDLDAPLSEISTSISPATLVPHFDFDTKLLFLSGKVKDSLTL